MRPLVAALTRKARWTAIFAARVLYRALVKHAPAAQRLARAAESSGMISAAEIQQATSFAQNTYRRLFRQRSYGTATARFIMRLSGLSARELRLAATTSAIWEQPAIAEKQPYVPPAGLLPWFNPLPCVREPLLAASPRINVLIPSLQRRHMSGGPNTALIIARGLADQGERVRLISCDDAPANRQDVLDHMGSLTRAPLPAERIEVVDGSNKAKPVAVGPFDVFFATAWWTAQKAKYALQLTAFKEFIYLIQDFEPLLEPASSGHALALETYDLPHIPIVNTRLLHAFLAQNAVGQFAKPEFARRALVFDPAVDRALFHPERVARKGKHRLLFYARPGTGLRNMFELGVAALQKVAYEGQLDPSRWEAYAMGEELPPLALAPGLKLTPLPWLDLARYAQEMRRADLLLSLMLSPHPSYPPLEMAACGNLVVTNTYATKTERALREISPNIVATPPTIEGIAEALVRCTRRVEAGEQIGGEFTLPRTWDEALSPVVDRLADALRSLRRERQRVRIVAESKPPASGYERYRSIQLRERRNATPAGAAQPGLLAFLTTVYDTPPSYLRALAASVLLQDGAPPFEWVILDNGSQHPETRAVLTDIAWHHNVRVHRVEQNLGIVGGMRFCLEKASARYVAPLDSDDLLSPDAVAVLSAALVRHGYPPLMYTDEDKVSERGFEDPYFKPDWDPVLFVNSCYIAHLCAIERESALALGVYSDPEAEGCHDWDTFMRFYLSGRVPRHVPAAVYSWRVHSGSTSINIGSKPFVFDSHRRVLGRFVDALPAGRFELVASPFFDRTPDWWVRRKRVQSSELARIRLRSGAALVELESALARCANDLIHLSWEGIEPHGDEWPWEALGAMEQFPDTVMVGGPLLSNELVLSASLVFGFAPGCGSPDRGLRFTQPGYFAQLWKPHSVAAVSSCHCVLRREFLAQAMPLLKEHGARLALLGPWLGAIARRRGGRVVYTPFLRSLGTHAPEDRASSADWGSFLETFADLMPEHGLYSQHLGLEPSSAYVPVGTEQRRTSLRGTFARANDYPAWLERDLQSRARRYPLPAMAPSFCLLTTVYPGTDPKLLTDLAESLFRQTYAFTRWVIVAHGQISAALDGALNAIAAHQGVELCTTTEDLGIARAMQKALAAAQEEYVVPVDADDLVMPDALQILAHEARRRRNPEMLYSDEDLLIDGEPAHPFRRPDFDPVLNLETSYIWHLCAVRRDAALAAELYSDEGATWSHDWDTVFRIHDAGGRIEHISEILYHWRRHSSSISNTASGSNRSIASVTHLLEKRRMTLRSAADFVVCDFPLDRGARELYLSRAGGLAPTVTLAQAGRTLECDKDLVAVIAADVAVDLERSAAEAARLFALHENVVGVGGRVISAQGVVRSACAIVDRFGRLCSPYRDMPAHDGGPYALALKPHCVARLCGELSFFRASFLRAHEIALAAVTDPSELVRIASSLALSTGRRLAYSPLVQGTSELNGAAPVERTDMSSPILGLAGYVGRHGIPA